MFLGELVLQRCQQRLTAQSCDERLAAFGLDDLGDAVSDELT